MAAAVGLAVVAVVDDNRLNEHALFPAYGNRRQSVRSNPKIIDPSNNAIPMSHGE